jgi:hypothetical protein
MDLMQGLLENLPVVAMLLWAYAGWLAAAALLLALSALQAARRGAWLDARRRRAATLTFLAALPLMAALAFALLGGGPGDMGYWLDWLFLGAICAGGALYAALAAYLLVLPAAGAASRAAGP